MLDREGLAQFIRGILRRKQRQHGRLLVAVSKLPPEAILDIIYTLNLPQAHMNYACAAIYFDEFFF